ncbi:hypothetical protein CR152_11635 [Massilia violaceinigra]|uniref:Transcriptional regulator n=1 Tax=Massilia violaceinigra TaxID=2045208 RepID=A0A2D2DV24_9BURK|nr:hypothetical protein CR152_11635 [Massilia violaceinigra]
MARAFNIRFPHMTVTSHAARKWLMGEALPTQEKLVALAEWLEVEPTWLRFGNASSSESSASVQKSGDRIESDIRLLSEPERKIIRAALDAVFSARQILK